MKYDTKISLIAGGVIAAVLAGAMGIRVYVAHKIYGDWTCAISSCRREIPLERK